MKYLASILIRLICIVAFMGDELVASPIGGTVATGSAFIDQSGATHHHNPKHQQSETYTEYGWLNSVAYTTNNTRQLSDVGVSYQADYKQLFLTASLAYGVGYILCATNL